RTPARLERLEAFTSRPLVGEPADSIDSAGALLRALGYRTELHKSKGSDVVDSVSAERGYLRETGNLVFHASLIGVLVAVGLVGSFGYTGQVVLAEGKAFSNGLESYDSFNPGRF